MMRDWVAMLHGKANQSNQLTDQADLFSKNYGIHQRKL